MSTLAIRPKAKSFPARPLAIATGLLLFAALSGPQAGGCQGEDGIAEEGGGCNPMAGLVVAGGAGVGIKACGRAARHGDELAGVARHGTDVVGAGAGAGRHIGDVGHAAGAAADGGRHGGDAVGLAGDAMADGGRHAGDPMALPEAVSEIARHADPAALNRARGSAGSLVDDLAAAGGAAATDADVLSEMARKHGAVAAMIDGKTIEIVVDDGGDRFVWRLALEALEHGGKAALGEPAEVRRAGRSTDGEG